MRAAPTRDGLVFTGELEVGFVAYVDGAAAARGGDVEAFVVAEGGAQDDPRIALGALSASIRDALAGTSGRMEITADGAVASVLRSERAQPPEGARPDVVVDLTGDPATLRAATQRLADLGTLVLARDPTAQLDLDLYPDVHVRGLRLVGAPAPTPAEHGTPVDIPAGIEDPAPASVGAPVSPNRAWYRVTAGTSRGAS